MYVASEANTADVFTKALAPCDHQRCCTQLGLLCFDLLDWSCVPDGYVDGWPHAKSWPHLAKKKGTASGGARGSSRMEWFMTTKLSTEELRQAIAKLVVTCDLPFRIVESEAVSVPCLLYEGDLANFIPSRWTVSRHTVVFAAGALWSAIAEMLAKEGELGCKVSITIDMWTAPNNKAWLVVTGQWIDENFQLRTMVLEFCEMLGRHGGREMAQVVEETVVQWGLEGRCIGVTSDNTSGNIAAFRRMSEEGGGQCFFNSRMHFRFPHTSPQTIPSIQQGLSKTDKKRVESLRLTDADWETLQVVKTFLSPFTKVSKAAEGAAYPTVSMVVPYYNDPIDAMKSRLAKGPSPTLQPMIVAALSHLKKYAYITSNKYWIATFLDPSMKAAWFEDAHWEKLHLPLGPLTTTAATTAIAAPVYCATMASLRVLAFDHEGRPVAFNTWLDDLQLYLLSDIKDSVSLFDHEFGAAPAPPATADSATRSQTAQALYDAVVPRYSSPANAALGRLLLPYLFPELSAFATVVDLVSHLCNSDARYRATVLAEFLATNQPPMFITLYFIVTRLPDSLRSVRDHFLTLDPTSFTVDLLEQHLLVAETSAVAVGAARGTPCPPFFEGCSSSPLVPSFASAAAADVSVAEDVGAASASAKCRSSKGKGGRGGGGGSGGVGGGSGSGGGGGGGGGGGSGGGGSGGTGGRSGGSGSGSGGTGGSGGSGGGGTGSGGSGPRRGGPGGGPRSSSSVGAGPSHPSSSTCRKLHIEHRYFSRLDDAWRAEFGDDVERPSWADLLKSGVAIFDLDYDVILSAMYALSVSAEGVCYRCVPRDPGIAAAALGAIESGTLPGTAPAQALHTFTLDSGASRFFFRDSTTLTPLSTLVPVRLADPSGGPVVARSSTVLSCLAVPSGSLPGLHLPSFSTILVSSAALQDAMVTTTTPMGQHVSICTCIRMGRHLATFTRGRGSSLYTQATEPPQVAASAKVSASGQVAASCSCRLLLQQTLLWHHRPGHPSLPRLRGMHSRLLVSGLPRSLPLLLPSPALPCLLCIKEQQRAAPHFSSFPSTTAPVQTLHMDVWGPARVSGQGRERYFLLVDDDYTRYTTVFPLCSKGEVVDVLIPWIRTVRLQLRERFGLDLPVLRLHSDRGGEFSSDLLRDFCRGEGILKSFTLPASTQENGIAERHIGLVMELNLWPRVSLPETSPTLRWTGKVGDASVFRVWGYRAFVRDTSADKLFARAIPNVFLGFVPDAHGWQFYHPTSRRVLPSQDVTFDKSVPFYRSCSLGCVSGQPSPWYCACSGAAPGAASRGAASGGAVSGGAEPGGAGSEGAGSGGAGPGGEEPGGAEPEGVEPGGPKSEGAESGGATCCAKVLLVLHLDCLRNSCGSGLFGPHIVGVELPELEELETLSWSGAGAAGTGGVGGAGAGDPTEPGAAGARGAGAGGAGVGGPGAGGPVAAEAGVGGTGAGGAGAAGAGALVLGVPSSTGLTPPFLCPPPDQSQPPLQLASPLPAPSPYTEQFSGLTECREPASCLVSPVRSARRVPCSCPPPVPGTHAMALRPSSVPLRVPLPAPPESSLPEVPDPEFDCTRAASPTVSRLLAIAVTDPSFESAAASALVAELIDFAAACHLDYAAGLVAESASASPPSVGGECALGTDVLEDSQEDFECLAAAVPRFASMLLAPEGDPNAPDIPTPRSYAEAITGPYSSQWQEAMDAEMAS
ncbi:unnamed protein product [Closterium sp. NIES-53]